MRLVIVLCLLCAPALVVVTGCTPPPPGLDAGTGDDGGNPVVDGGSVDGGAPDAGGPRDLCAGDVDCPGGTCDRVPDVAGAGRRCVVPDATAPQPCTDAGPVENGACCADGECTGGSGPGRCVPAILGRCGGGVEPGNLCLAPECGGEADCQVAQACVPGGAFGFVVATCVPAACHVDADCTDHPGGQCRPLNAELCRRFDGFHCTYAQDPCRADDDCTGNPAGEVCVANQGGDGAVCAQGQFPP